MTIYTANGPGKSVSTKTFNKNNKKLIFACRCWPAFKTNQLFSCWQSLRASKNNEEQAHLVYQVFCFAFCPTSFKVMVQYLFSTVFVFAKWQFSFKSTVTLRAQLMELILEGYTWRQNAKVWERKTMWSTNKGFVLGRGNLRQSWILDSTPWIPDSRYWIPKFASETRRLFTWREEDPSTRKIVEGGTTLR